MKFVAIVLLGLVLPRSAFPAPALSLRDRDACVVTMAFSIARMEGANKPGSIASLNNNPMCLRFTGQRGAVAGVNGYAKFAKLTDGFRAGVDDITAKLARGQSPLQIVRGWSRSDPDRYEKSVRRIAGKYQWSACEVRTDGKKH